MYFLIIKLEWLFVVFAVVNQEANKRIETKYFQKDLKENLQTMNFIEFSKCFSLNIKFVHHKLQRLQTSLKLNFLAKTFPLLNI